MQADNSDRPLQTLSPSNPSTSSGRAVRRTAFIPVLLYNCRLQRRRRFHLSKNFYIGRRTYFLTICSAGRAQIFLNRTLAEKVILFLKQDAAATDFLLHAWCLMPDHLHILAEGTHEQSDLFQFIRRFKHRTATEFSSTDRTRLWQHNFYEHIVRNRETVARIAGYIWMNPVRARLCQLPNEYPFAGSLTLGWTQTLGSDKWLPPWKTKPAGR